MLAPTDKTALVAPVMAAKRKKIPVVIIDSGIATKEIDSFVATDNLNGGKLAARELSEANRRKETSPSCARWSAATVPKQREKGFLEAIKEFPKSKSSRKTNTPCATESNALERPRTC